MLSANSCSMFTLTSGSVLKLNNGLLVLPLYFFTRIIRFAVWKKKPEKF